VELRQREMTIRKNRPKTRKVTYENHENCSATIASLRKRICTATPYSWKSDLRWGMFNLSSPRLLHLLIYLCVYLHIHCGLLTGAYLEVFSQ
jgi:hypothetical protein